jgi:hypothetical protein
MFAPVPVGLATPPIQDYAFYNGGSVNATYEIDLSPLDELHKVQKFLLQISSCEPSNLKRGISKKYRTRL